MFKKIMRVSFLIIFLQIAAGILLFYNKFSFKGGIPYYEYYIATSAGILLLLGCFILFRSKLVLVDIFFALSLLNAIALSVNAVSVILIVTSILWIATFICYLVWRIKIQRAI